MIYKPGVLYNRIGESVDSSNMILKSLDHLLRWHQPVLSFKNRSGHTIIIQPKYRSDI